MSLSEVAWDGAGAKGSAKYPTTPPPDFHELAAVPKTCAVLLAPDATVKYDDVIHVLDSLIHAGFTSVSVGKRGDKPTPTTADGKLDKAAAADLHAGSFAHGYSKDEVKTLPVIVITTKTVSIAGKTVGKLDDADLAKKVAAALPANPKLAGVIVEADKDVEAAAVTTAIDGAKSAGYNDVLFAVKAK